jgi:hypothetical protein
MTHRPHPGNEIDFFREQCRMNGQAESRLEHPVDSNTTEVPLCV